MILLSDKEGYNLLALDTVLAIWPSQLGKETTSLKWIPTHLERDREGEREKGRTEEQREGGREGERASKTIIISSNKTYKTGCLSAELTMHTLYYNLFKSFCKLFLLCTAV